jgi:LysR family transcriptional regulator, regulator of abg operon
VRLTPAGTLVAARAATVVREIERAREDVAWQMRYAASHVAISASPAAAIVVLPGALARLRSRWPQVRVQVMDAVYPRALTMLRAGEVDLAVGPLPEEGAGRDLRVQPLFDARQVLVVRPENPLAGARTLAELQHADWIVAGPTGGPGDPMHLGFDVRGMPNPPVTVTCESFSTLLALVPSVNAVAVMPAYFYDSYAAPRGLVQLPFVDPLPTVSVHIAWRADAPLTAPASHLLDALEQEARAVRSGRRP